MDRSHPWYWSRDLSFMLDRCLPSVGGYNYGWWDGVAPVARGGWFPNLLKSCLPSPDHTKVIERESWTGRILTPVHYCYRDFIVYRRLFRHARNAKG